MADETKKPVIFLAFANSRDDTVDYLRNLPVETRRLRDALKPAEQAGLCEVEVRTDCTAGDIFGVFQDPNFRNRIAIFHYGGHANGYQLLLESEEGKAAAADAGGLAEFFAEQQGLQLVFLNGCSTQEQTLQLHNANVSVVISTSQRIEDKVATDFAFQFYQGLAGGATIRVAYNEAVAAVRTVKGVDRRSRQRRRQSRGGVQTVKGGDPRSLYYGDKKGSQGLPDVGGWPWKLHPPEGAECTDRWSLKVAANDPLFGLPPLPKQDLPNGPYKYLAAFTHADAEVFFGRGHQIRELYEGLTTEGTDPIMLFYGQSGVGKSSIFDAGLFPRFLQDYDVHYLRRGEGGLLKTLQSALLPKVAATANKTAWQAKENQTGKPLIVFLDQVEEFYTRPIKDFPKELDQLLQFVRATFRDPNRRPQGKLVLGFRKEWLAELEAQLQGLPYTKFFLEPLDRSGIIEVVRGPAQSKRLHDKYKLTVEDGLAETIADNLLEDRGSALAPTLQILLTKMYEKATDADNVHPKFSRDLYQTLKRDGILLKDFLSQQIKRFEEHYPKEVESGLLLDILAQHTTPLGTADERTVVKLQEQYAHVDTILPAILQRCQDLHLLTVATSTRKGVAKTTRLAHDTLAPMVREQFDGSNTPGQRARRILDNRSVDWEGGREGSPLEEVDLSLVEKGVDGTRALNKDERRLVQASRETRAKRIRTRKLRKLGAVAFLLAVTVTAGFTLWQWREATNTLVDRRRVQVATLRTTTPAEAGQLLKKITESKDEKDEFEGEMREQLAMPISGIEANRIRLGLLASDPAQRDQIVDYVLNGEQDLAPAELALIRGALAPHGSAVAARFWATSTNQDLVLLAASFLAVFDKESPKWQEMAPRVAESLVQQSPTGMGDWLTVLKPVAKTLVKPLTDAFRKREAQSESLLAAVALANFAKDDRAELVELCSEATPSQFDVLFPVLKSNADIEQTVRQLKEFVKTEPPVELNDPARVDFGRRRAGAAISLLRLAQDPNALFPALEVQNDPEALTQFVHGCRPRSLDPQRLADCFHAADGRREAARKLDSERLDKKYTLRKAQDSVLFGLLLALGEFDLQTLPDEHRQFLLARLQELFRSDPSSSIHGATRWLLSKWQERVIDAAAAYDPKAHPEREWYTIEVSAKPERPAKTAGPASPLYLTFVVVDVDNDRGERLRRIGVLDSEVTRRAFLAAGVHLPYCEFPGNHLNASYRTYGDSEDLCITNSCWYDAIRFCRWLSASFGYLESEQAYIDPSQAKEFDDAGVAKHAPKGWPADIDKRGFRLPTGAEWETACQRQLDSTFSFGSDRTLLRHYAWYAADQSEKRVNPVRHLRPNLQGLFDMHGNVREWCQDEHEGKRMNRGGGWLVSFADFRSKHPDGLGPGSWSMDLGFRVVQTLSDETLRTTQEDQ